jgi:hypothetical protein
MGTSSEKRCTCKCTLSQQSNRCNFELLLVDYFLRTTDNGRDHADQHCLAAWGTKMLYGSQAQ